MTRTRRALGLGALALAAFLGSLVAVRAGGPSATADPAAAPVAAVRTSFPDLHPTAEEPTLDGLDRLSPAPGSVVRAPGPFDDRLQLDRLTLDETGVSGSAVVTSDVSEILEFVAEAGFYDREGHLLGTGRYVHHLDESAVDPTEETGPPNELEQFTIPIPANLQGRAVSAAIGVPMLVNE